jgi:hypothetical protein
MSNSNFEDKVLGYLAHLTQEVAGINNRLGSVEGALVTIEKVHGDKLSALFDGQKSHTEQLNRLENKVDGLTQIVSGHDVAIEAMKRAK